MTREEERRQASIEYHTKPHYEAIKDDFLRGAEWADKYPDAISMNYLQSWYQCSIDETQEPIWTDKHLEELFNDFYLIPKIK